MTDPDVRARVSVSDIVRSIKRVTGTFRRAGLKPWFWLIVLAQVILFHSVVDIFLLREGWFGLLDLVFSQLLLVVLTTVLMHSVEKCHIRWNLGFSRLPLFSSFS